MANKEPKTTLEIIIAMVEEREQASEQLSRLKVMEGIAADDRNPKCTTVKFDTPYGASAYTRSSAIGLNQLLVTTAIKYYEDAIGGLDTVLDLAKQGIEKNVGDAILTAIRTKQVTNVE